MNALGTLDVFRESTQFLSVAADYTAEIENAVGEEIYGPIFKAGLFIFVSGLVSSAVVAFIVSKSNSWEGLEEEFQRGKEAQLIDLTSKLTTSHLFLLNQLITFNFADDPLPILSDTESTKSKPKGFEREIEGGRESGPEIGIDADSLRAETASGESSPRIDLSGLDL